MAGFINVTTKMFLNKSAVIAAMDRKNQKVLYRTGGFGRKVMRSGMRRRKNASQPGEYPSAHAGQLKELIYFGIDETNSLVIGPTVFPGAKGKAGGGKTVPQLLNEGGVIPGRRFLVPRRNPKSNESKFVLVNNARRPMKYRPRPFVELSMPATIEAFRKNMEEVELK